MSTSSGIGTAYEMHDVSRVYEGQPPVRAVRDVDLTIRSGDYVALTGRSGSGKSTMLNMLGLLDLPSRGSLHFLGRNVARLSDAERTHLRGREIGFVFQAFHLIDHRSALQNVVLAMTYQRIVPAERRKLAERALCSVGLTDKSNVLASKLSGGQQQRVAIARAIASGPSVLLCDEPTGNLDSDSAAGIIDLMEQLCAEGLTLIVVTHDPGVASRANRQLHMVDGTLQSGSHGHGT